MEIRRPDIPIGKWVKCEKCHEILYKEEVHKNFSICPNCNAYFRLSSRRRLKQMIDEESFEKFNWNLKTANPLNLGDYEKKIEALKEKTALEEAVLCGKAKIEGKQTILCMMDGNFLMGSMGVVVGEMITRSIEEAIKEKLPIIIFTASGGARMQEGIQSLMQMAKTTEAVARLNQEGILYIAVLTDPTYGGVTASFASLADIILAEKGANIGFAGKRVIKQTIGQDLPEDFQTAEFLLQHGFIDKIVERQELRHMLACLLRIHEGGKQDE